MLSWPNAALIAGSLGVFGVLGLLVREPRVAVAAGVAREAALLFGLYGLWQFAGQFTAMSEAGGIARGRWIWHAERVLHLPSEAAVQRIFLPHPVIIQAFNLYYDILHFPMLIACLIWVYAWHRDSYPRIRTLVVLFTAASLLVQLIPVAPPRLLPGTGLVDTAFRYGESVYTWGNGALAADQYSAMPSVHVGWALIVAIAVVTVSRSRWRWVALGYPALTLLVVVVTANHYWFDGIAAGVLVALAVLVQRFVHVRALFRGRGPCDDVVHDERERAGTLA
jgi:PAP2 superfamily